MSKIEYYILDNKVPKDLDMFFIRNIREKYIYNMILNKYLNIYELHFDNYIKWRKEIKGENIGDKIARINKISLHYIKYNMRFINKLKLYNNENYKKICKKYLGIDIGTCNVRYRYLLRTFYLQKISNNREFIFDLYKFPLRLVNKCTIPRVGDILSCILLNNFKIGDEFVIKIKDIIVNRIILTKENINNLWIPIENKLPIIIYRLGYIHTTIECVNRICNENVKLYYMLMCNRKNLSSIIPIKIGNKIYIYQGNYLYED